MTLGVTSAVHQITTLNTTANSASLDTTGAKDLLFYIKYDRTTPTSITWSDNKGNNASNVTQIQTQKTFASQLNVGYRWPVTTVGAGHIITASWTTSAVSEIMFGGVTATNPTSIDTSADWLFSSSPAFKTAAVTTSNANTIVVGMYDGGLGTTDAGLTPGSGYTIWDHDESATILQMVFIYQIVSSIGTYQPNFTSSYGGNSFGLTIALFEGAPPPPLLGQACL